MNAEVTLLYSADLEPFYVGYAYEALARAESLAGNVSKAAEYIQNAGKYAAQITKPEDQKLLLDDLASI
jgi:hypothetical protein